MKHFITACFLFAAFALAGCKTISDSDQVTTISIIDRNGHSETISSKDRLEAYQKTDFLSPQPYQKVLKIYARDKKGDIRSQITCYHPNGQIKQYLEVVNNRAFGLYKEWYSNGQLKIEAQVIGGVGDINNQAQQSYLFDGISHAYNDQGNLIAEIQYLKGELNGESKYYHSNGKIWKTSPYKNNFLEGIQKIYLDDGSLLMTTQYKNGLKEGESLRFWTSDQIAHQEFYNQNLLMEGCYYYQNGELAAEIKKGHGFKALFNKQTLQELHEYKEGLPDGIVKIFNDKRGIIKTYHVKNEQKEGEEIDFFSGKSSENPQPKMLVTWKNGMIQGPVKTWYESGNLESIREMSQNKKNGLLSAWYKNGSLMLVEEYDNDKLIKGEYYRINEKIPISKIERGQGIAMLHHSDGFFNQKVVYRNGIPENDLSE